MDDQQINNEIAQLRRYKREAEDLREKIEAIETAVKAEMEARGVETLETENYRVTWKPVSTTRIDTKAFQQAFPDVAQAFAKTTITRRLCVA